MFIESGMCRAKIGKFKSYDAHYIFNDWYLKKDNKVGNIIQEYVPK